MMAGNPNWWALFPPSFAEQPQSWSQLLLGEEDRVLNQTQIMNNHYQLKKLENWEDHDHDHQILNNNSSNPSPIAAPNFVDILKQQVSNIRDQSTPPSHHTNKFLNFSCDSSSNPDHNINQQTVTGGGCADYSPESNPSAAVAVGGACKKARVHPPSSSQPPLKVRKEKLVDRITALHQIVSPFGKTDTASVLSEAIGYIRFLQGQIEAFSYPYLRSAPKDLRNSQPVGEKMMSQSQEKPLKDLRSRGLCLVPISCTQLVGGDNNNNGAAYWAPAYGTTGF